MNWSEFVRVGTQALTTKNQADFLLYPDRFVAIIGCRLNLPFWQKAAPARRCRGTISPYRRKRPAHPCGKEAAVEFEAMHADWATGRECRRRGSSRPICGRWRRSR